MKTISIVVPCYNEEENVQAMADALRETFKKDLPAYRYEILFIDNDSKDRTREIIRKLCAEDKGIKGIFNAKNFGQFNSPYYAMLQTTGDATVLMAADFQDPVEMIPKFVAEWENGYKIVSGIKSHSKENKFIYMLRTIYYKMIRKMSDVEMIEHFTGFGLYDKTFIFIADAQALTDNIDNPEKVRQNVIEVALDYMAVGLDPTKSTIFIQSQIPELCELTFYYMDLVTVSRLQRNPTVKTEIQMRNFETSIPVGFFTYPISQAADITAFRATTVPVGEDQEPMIEQTREIVRRFNHIYGDTLVEPEILLPDNAACLRLPGTDGKAKMSKSLGNCIYLSDTADEVEKKVKGMYTDPTHIKVSDPGKLEGNTVFTYLDAFCKPEHFERYLSDYPNLDELKAHYTRGGLGDMKVKKFLAAIMQEELTPIRERRKEFEKDIPAIYEMLRRGCETARATAAETLDDVRKAMKINYFDDAELIAEQAKRFGQE